MENLKLTIDLLPKGAWNNDLSRILSKKDWDTLRNFCYKKANHRCQICGFQTDELDAHEVWEFDIIYKTQTLKDIMAICSKCHGVKHFKNSVRLGFGEEAKKHFLKVNKCSEMEFANHLNKALIEYEQRNKIFRWKMFADLSNFGGKDIKIKERNIPNINNPYKDIDWYKLTYTERKKLFTIISNPDNFISPPKIIYLNINNYQGKITIVCMDANKIEWFLNGNKIKTKYNVIGKWSTTFSVENLQGNPLYFKLTGDGGEITSKKFALSSAEVI